MNVSAEASRKIENMSLLCAILVVTIHVGWSDQTGSTGWWIAQLVKRGIASIAVPFFFVVSGFFLSAHFCEKGWWPRETKKRIISLVIPFFLWLMLSVVSGWPLSIVADVIAHRPFGTSIYLPVDNPVRFWGLDFSFYPGLVPLWYVRCLFVFVVISPLIKWMISKFGYAWLIFLYCASLAILFGRSWFYCDVETGCPLSYLTCGLSIGGMFYFSAGIMIRKMGWCTTSRKWAIVGLALAGELMAFKSALSYSGVASFIPIPFVPFVLYGIWHFIPSKPLPPFLRGCSFPIFLMHMIVFGYVRVVLGKLPIDLNDTMGSVVFVVFGTLVPIAFCNVLRKCSPFIAKVLFCGRT